MRLAEYCVHLGALVLEILNLWVLLPMLSTFLRETGGCSVCCIDCLNVEPFF